MDAIILCGGMGTRLGEVVSDVPKPLAPVAGRPFLDYLLDHLRRTVCVTRVILATGHLAAKVHAHYGERYFELPIAYSSEIAPLGTGGAVIQAVCRFAPTDPFFILNGDSFVDVDLDALRRLHLHRASAMSLTLFRVEDAARFGTVTCWGDSVTGFAEKKTGNRPGLINAGIYAASPAAFSDWIQVKGPVSLENDVLPVLVRSGLVSGLESGTRFIDIGLPSSYAAAEAFFIPA